MARPSVSTPKTRRKRQKKESLSPSGSPHELTPIPLRVSPFDGLPLIADAAATISTQGRESRSVERSRKRSKEEVSRIESLRKQMQKRQAATALFALNRIKEYLKQRTSADDIVELIKDELNGALEGEKFGISKLQREFDEYQADRSGRVPEPKWPDRNPKDLDETY